MRNSILLVDFIRIQMAASDSAPGRSQAESAPSGGSASGAAGKRGGLDHFREAIVQSAITRAQPIALTALAAMIGALFILDDPIFNGLAISLIFGVLVSTVLTLVVIPLLYYAAYRKSHADDTPVAATPPAQAGT